MIKNKNIIDRIQKINDIKLLPHEIRILDMLIEAKKSDNKIIIKHARQSSRSLDRVYLLCSVYPKALFPKKIKYNPRKNKKKYDYKKKSIIFDEFSEIEVEHEK